MRQNYDSNIYRTADNEVSEWSSIFSPALTLSSSGLNDSLQLSYIPSLVYSYYTHDNRIDHHFSLNGEKGLTSTLRFLVRDTFIQTENPVEEEEASIEIADKRGQNRYWINTLSTGVYYTFAPESELSVSYGISHFDNEDPSILDYIKHTPGISMSYRYSPRWRSQLSYIYTKGDFEQIDESNAKEDQSNDLQTNEADLSMYYNTSPSSAYFVHYGFTNTDYDNLREDYAVHTPSLGWEHSVTKQAAIDIEAGASLLERDFGDDRSAMFYELGLSNTLQHGSVSVQGKGGFDNQLYSGTSDETSLVRYWQLKGDMRYQYIENFITAIYCQYREEKFLERTPEETEHIMQAGISFSYTFLRRYTLSLDYDYTQRFADRAEEEYTDNRFFIQLSYKNELLKW